ncbi:MAG TPA: hypothetical protein VE623_01090 [Acidimicrobiales bacterium]|nr:hypothetical protein [Acidimicrobiales bacterium]
MERVFGVPVGAFAIALLAIMAIAFGVVAVGAVRNRVFLRMATRNAIRRRARSALIVGGLMLATAIIGSSLVTGDTMGRTIRSSVLRVLGETDDTVVVAGAELDPTLQVGAVAPVAYFDEGAADTVRAAAAASPLVDGLAPAVIEPVAVQDRSSRRSEPQVTLFGADPASLSGFDDITGQGGGTLSLADLGPGEAFLTEAGADELGARAGDPLVVFGGAGPVDLVVREVVAFRGAGADGPALLAPLGLAQQIVGEEGRISHVLVSNVGGVWRQLHRRRRRPAGPRRRRRGARGRAGEAGRSRAGRPTGQRVHVAVLHLRHLRHRRRHPADLPDLRDARG